jgi:hypothetical protein
MSWRRRLLGLWLVLSLCWIAGVGVYAWKQEPGLSSSQFAYETASSPEKQNESDPRTRATRRMGGVEL